MHGISSSCCWYIMLGVAPLLPSVIYFFPILTFLHFYALSCIVAKLVIHHLLVLEFFILDYFVTNIDIAFPSNLLKHLRSFIPCTEHNANINGFGYFNFILIFSYWFILSVTNFEFWIFISQFQNLRADRNFFSLATKPTMQIWC
jgi:hypothetical protein